MLVLSRKMGESIVLPGFEVSISLLSVHGDRATLGVTAPLIVEVHRQEVWERIRSERSIEVTPAAALEPAPHLPK